MEHQFVILVFKRHRVFEVKENRKCFVSWCTWQILGDYHSLYRIYGSHVV